MPRPALRQHFEAGTEDVFRSSPDRLPFQARAG